MSTTAPGGEQGLVRAIGVRGLTASIVNTTIGAGIFVLPALVARDLGGAAPLAYVACAMAMTCVVASFAMAGSRVSLTGGIYAYVEVAFGPLVGFLTGVLVWLSCLLAAASVASALAASVALAVPIFGQPALRALGLGLVFALFASVNVRGVATGTRLVEVITATKLLPLVLLTTAGLLWVKPEHLVLEWAAPDRIGTASMTLIFAFAGIEVALVPSGEIRDPSRTVPRAVFLALGVTTLLYLLVQLVAHAVLGSALASYTEAPLAEVASRVLGPLGRTLVLVGGSISMLGFLSGDALGSPRSLYAFARDARPAPSALPHAVDRDPHPRPHCLDARLDRQLRRPRPALECGVALQLLPVLPGGNRAAPPQRPDRWAPVRAAGWRARAGAGLHRGAVAALARQRPGVRGNGRRRPRRRAALRRAADAHAGDYWSG